MINLVPPAARKNIVREYWLRVVSVWLFLLGTGCMIVAVLLLPTYMIVRGQIANLDGQVSATAEKTATFDGSAAALISASAEAALLTKGASTTVFSQYVKSLERIAGNDVVIHSIVFSTDGIAGGKMTVAGMANTRQSLVTFRDGLEADPAFVTVVLPIAALIKDRDLLFSMDITLATSTLPTTP